MLRLVSLLSLLAIAAPACVDPADAELGTTEQAVIECDTWVCGSNSPVISTYRFHELNINGLANAEGFQVLSLWKAGTYYHLYVEQGRIIGRAGALQIQGAALVGAEIRLRNGLKLYAIKISEVGTVQTFARLFGTTRTLETYKLDGADVTNGSTDFRNLCANTPSRYNADVLGMNVAHALVFEGERIDKDAKTIDPVLDPTWFNIGCAGHALAKLAINAQTEAAHQAFGFNTTIAERQGFLKMLVADYCGTGTSFTVSGQPLEWKDWRGYTQYVSNPVSLALEARWSENGAVCLNTPRVNANPSPLGSSTFGTPLQLVIAIWTECGNALPPACSGTVTELGTLPLNSANP